MNYQNGKVYKIESHLGDKVYIGSTTKKYLSQRMTAHRKNYNQWKNHKRDLTTSFLMFDEYGIENCNIVLLESYPCNSKDELTKQEAHHIRTTKNVNKVIPGRTEKQYYQDNKELICNQSKEYRLVNKDVITVNAKMWRDAHKEDAQQYRDAHKEEMQKYRLDNRDTLNEKQRLVYQANKEAIQEKHKQYRAKNWEAINTRERARRAKKNIII